MLGVVFQHPSLDPHLTASENLSLGARLFGGCPAKEAATRSDELLGFMEVPAIAPRSELRPSRAAFEAPTQVLARAIIHRPSVLILDEPTAGLDPHAFERTWRLIDGLKKSQQLTVLASTHGENEAAKCDKLVVLDNGKVVAFDTPRAQCSRRSAATS